MCWLPAAGTDRIIYMCMASVVKYLKWNITQREIFDSKLSPCGLMVLRQEEYIKFGM